MSKVALLGRYVDVVNSKVVESGAVLVEENKIVYVGEENSAPISVEYKKIQVDGTILPGFIDCHIHISGSSDDNYYSVRRDKLVLKAASDMKDMLQSGFTAARDMTEISANLKWAVEKGYMDGPRLMPGGQVLSVTSGHGDMDTEIPLELAKENLVTCLVDGVEECLKGVRKQFRDGAEFIKICATGGVSSMQDGLEDVQFSNEEMKAMVEEAKRHGTYVAAHCSGLEGAKQALKLGVTSIEHGINLDQECVDIMKENNCSLVTTLHISLNLHKYPNLPEYMARKAKLCADANLKSIKLVREAGINVALGTDFSNKAESSNNYKYLGKEFKAICDAGFSNMQSIQIGTINGAKLMKKENEIGSLDVGKFADIVVCTGNPLENIEVLSDAENIKFVMKDGKIYKNCF